MPWEFWTEEERSLVIREGYRDLIITSPEVKQYLDVSRTHFWTQWLVPLGVAAAVFGPFRGIFAHSFRQHVTVGYKRTQYRT